jgi:hypothetical protein
METEPKKKCPCGFENKQTVLVFKDSENKAVWKSKLNLLSVEGLRFVKVVKVKLTTFQNTALCQLCLLRQKVKIKHGK